MSGKSAKTPKKLSIPRTIEEIQQHAAQIYMRLGQAEYQRNIFAEEVTKLQEEARRLNHEANSRNKLDADEKARKATEAQTQTQQTGA